MREIEIAFAGCKLHERESEACFVQAGHGLASQLASRI